MLTQFLSTAEDDDLRKFLPSPEKLAATELQFLLKNEVKNYNPNAHPIMTTLINESRSDQLCLSNYPLSSIVLTRDSRVLQVVAFDQGCCVLCERHLGAIKRPTSFLWQWKRCFPLKNNFLIVGLVPDDPLRLAKCELPKLTAVAISPTCLLPIPSMCSH